MNRCLSLSPHRTKRPWQKRAFVLRAILQYAKQNGAIVLGTTAQHLSKVITQSRPLFYVDRAGHRLTEEANGIEAEDLEPTEVS